MLSSDALALWQASSKLSLNEPDFLMELIFGIGLAVEFNAMVSAGLEKAI